MTEAQRTTPAGRTRARGLGIPFAGTPGPWNAITDVPGVEVGYTTLVQGTSVRTGVTAIHPRGRDAPGDACAAGIHSLNGNGELTGAHWIEESGTVALPITVTNTHSVGRAHSGTVAWVGRHHPALAAQWLLPVAAETWDGWLNDINGLHVSEEHVVEALEGARRGPLDQGSVGGGTGMNCYGFKGGVGTASREVELGGATFTVGVLLQCNFGSRHELTVAGVPLGADLAADDPLGDWAGDATGAGSVIGIVITDAPLLPNQCKALARRVPLGLARTGTTGSHFSGDVFLALSTGNAGAFTLGFPQPLASTAAFDSLRFVPWSHLDGFFAAVVHAVEEAVVDALVVNEEMVGRDGHRTPALPREHIVELLRAHGRLAG